MIQRLVIFGATGDLTARYLLPGLAALRAAGELGDEFELIASAREDADRVRPRRLGRPAVPGLGGRLARPLRRSGAGR